MTKRLDYEDDRAVQVLVNTGEPVTPGLEAALHAQIGAEKGAGGKQIPCSYCKGFAVIGEFPCLCGRETGGREDMMKGWLGYCQTCKRHVFINNTCEHI